MGYTVMTKKDPLVSVVMPAYNAEKFIGESIESILNQTFKDFEFIILDDCSKDGTWEIIQEYAKKDERIVPVKNEKNLNIALNRNKGVEMSKGKYIVWQDADDISKPERIEKLVNYMESHPEVGICGSFIQSFDEGGDLDIREYGTKDEQLRKCIFMFSPVAQPAAIIRKAAFDIVGKYNEDFPPAEDIDMSFRIGEHFQFANIPEVLLNYREHPESATHTRIKKSLKSTLAIRKIYIKSPKYKFNISARLAFVFTYLAIFLPYSVTIFLFKIIRSIIMKLHL